MKILVLFLAPFIALNAYSQKIDADQLEGLSDCDYFKYTQCTASKLTIGACVKNKYEGFVKACGKVHADKFLYSREMYKPPVKKGKKSCESAQSELCYKNGLSLSECAAKHSKELKASCGDEFLKEAANLKDMDECFKLRSKICGKEVDANCDAKFEAQAPAKCKNDPTPSTEKMKSGVASEKTMMDDCMKTITSECNLDVDAMMKDESAALEETRKYEVCVKRALTTAEGKCGSHFPGEKEIEKSVEDANK